MKRPPAVRSQGAACPAAWWHGTAHVRLLSFSRLGEARDKRGGGSRAEAPAGLACPCGLVAVLKGCGLGLWGPSFQPGGWWPGQWVSHSQAGRAHQLWRICQLAPAGLFQSAPKGVPCGSVGFAPQDLSCSQITGSRDRQLWMLGLTHNLLTVTAVLPQASIGISSCRSPSPAPAACAWGLPCDQVNLDLSSTHTVRRAHH